jgi:hypothetical protein
MRVGLTDAGAKARGQEIVPERVADRLFEIADQSCVALGLLVRAGIGGRSTKHRANKRSTDNKLTHRYTFSVMKNVWKSCLLLNDYTVFI